MSGLRIFPKMFFFILDRFFVHSCIHPFFFPFKSLFSKIRIYLVHNSIFYFSYKYTVYHMRGRISYRDKNQLIMKSGYIHFRAITCIFCALFSLSARICSRKLMYETFKNLILLSSRLYTINDLIHHIIRVSVRLQQQQLEDVCTGHLETPSSLAYLIRPNILKEVID